MFRLVGKGTSKRRRGGVIAAGAAVAAGLALLPAAANAQKPVGGPDGSGALKGAKILLSNDDSVQAAAADGADGRGLYFLRRSLCAAGADVVVVGPWQQQSGRARSISQAPQVALAAPTKIPAGFEGDCSTAPSKGVVLGACAATACTPTTASVTPADAVELALSAYLPQQPGWADGPDLVLTGTNSGANIDIAVNMSGTVGAATTAAEHGVPAIAVSANGSGLTSAPTDLTYRTAADFAAKTAARLLGRKGAADRLGEDKLLLNINVPDVTAGKTPTPRWTVMGDTPLGSLTYTADGKGGYRIGYTLADANTRLDPRSDTAALRDGRISIGAISVDRTADGKWLGSLNLAR
ncbi:5'-nucleotidase [Actinocorallia herbida]|uniref:5'-nucleotidase n=1 Tax=Actinocorallia herbida TaxID=58109 RepID=A0A3N1CUX6_9ACTN|nr:5'/3'-nucleotidase SurE [Actinocorallia herbida]ROO85077.1 5'-nucleotidase [Actinocorallia herbida]